MKNLDINQLIAARITERQENLYRLAFYYVKNKEDALDIVQESIRKALASSSKIKDAASIDSWLYKIIVRTALDVLRKNKKLTIADDETIEYLRSGEEDHYRDLDLQRAMEGLSIKYKTVVILRFFEDLKLEEIAEVLEENVSTIKTRLYKALQLLRINMTEQEETKKWKKN
ncbi:RNA polymerase sigma factor [Peribacillus butanolivorans]|uniref:RNA polymerase subunit sigma-70 n=1 Tax=Peribacillus butanolivorans TaxID=421767 RepID=A0AAX0S237_9BACI|nr:MULTISPECIES: sigma-70 family RNA polymerase sigma factor [Peribacillus]KRF65935.1 RNA polymerase subunit sigma-70 [Bacillus sp. Soil768D1]AXN38427.1 RNA polymerase subunit sigma-70 [Peribacillus butanolivorans]MBK5443576.1 sigma-70 family RNA polymerase sigma factor [Peribacillus sp. TH24]MBK5461698.1 sigma-70 family RNA polymerase sigma factor [Peribacillus sp. TH27]MBK5484982.1 sigma-70 family RNA polymerase sigma factor [Peribacillus sp. TH16]